MKAKFIKAVKTVERTVKQNSKCRNSKNIISCNECDLYSTCMANNYGEKLAKKRELSKMVYNSWEIEKEIRSNF